MRRGPCRAHPGPAVCWGTGFQDTKGLSPLHAACAGGHAEVTRTLLSAGALVGLQDKGGASPLFVVCLLGRVELAHTLLDARDLQDKTGHTPLHTASRDGHLDFVRALLSAGALVDSLNNDGRTALHIVCYVGHVEIVRALLAAGAQADLQDRDRRTALKLAARTTCPTLERLVHRALRNGRERKGVLRAGAMKVGEGSEPTEGDDGGSAQSVPTATVAVSPLAHSDEACDEAEGSYLPEADLSAEGSVPNFTRVRACCMCGGQPGSQGGAKLRRCGGCKSAQTARPSASGGTGERGATGRRARSCGRGGRVPQQPWMSMNEERGTVLCGASVHLSVTGCAIYPVTLRQWWWCALGPHVDMGKVQDHTWVLSHSGTLVLSHAIGDCMYTPCQSSRV